MLEITLLAVALSMDAFAVSIGLGSKESINHTGLALKAGLYFGIFQALMPLIGYLGGIGVLGWIEGFAPIIAFILLLLIGGKMIYEAFQEGIEEDIAAVTHKMMMVLAIATSIDALAAGFTLTLLDFNPLLACFIIGVTTFIFSFFGVFIGSKMGTWLENKAEFLGGVILIGIGFKILFF
ncbi:MAG: manganese efflux pump MntP [Zetaproteobacteria bacterium CG2_30_46_52]|nr:MAG: manganese efflux pump MntP [Zetaproteobacteria bacterium CG2_30_46_52]